MRKYLFGFLVGAALTFSGCSKLKVIEGEEGIAPLVLGNVEFKGGAKNGETDTYSGTVRVFPKEIVKIGCSAVNASQGNITFSSETGFIPPAVPLNAMDFPSCDSVAIDTTGWRPGSYTATVAISDSQGNTNQSNTFIIEVVPTVKIQNVVQSGGSATLELYYEYGVGTGSLSVNGTTVSPFPSSFDENGAFTHRNVQVPLTSNTASIVATVEMNGITGPNDTYSLLNNAPSFAKRDNLDHWSFVGCKLLGPSDFNPATELGLDAHQDAVWSWDAAGTTVTQTANNKPSTLLAKVAQSATPLSITGRWRTTNADDDFWGLVFDYRNNLNFHYFDWKKSTQTSSSRGARIRSVTLTSAAAAAANGQFWSGTDGTNITTLTKNETVAWQNGQSYFFRMQLQPNNVRITVTNEADGMQVVNLTQNGSFSGSWGLYNYSQPSSIFSDIGICPLNYGLGYVFQPTVTDPDNDTLTYTKTQGPAGLIVNRLTGKVSWNFPSIGTHKISIQASDSRGGLALLSYTLTVTAPM